MALPCSPDPAPGAGPAAAGRWRARLELGFRPDRSAGAGAPPRTRLCHRAHSGPLQVQRPFYPEPDGTCHILVLHPPGGVVGGDVLTLEAGLAPGSRVLLTAPAAGKFYRSAGDTPATLAEQRQHLRVDDAALLEWLPQETIVYRGARLDTLTRVELSGGARFLGWEILCLGRPAAGERFDRGLCRQRIEVWREGLPLFIDSARFDAGEIAGAGWGLRGQPVTATLVFAGHGADASPSPALLDSLRDCLDAHAGDGAIAGVSRLRDALVCRYLGPSTAQAKSLFGALWALLRPALMERPARPPRIWST